ncbi:MAG: hypothetical protein LBC80_02320 [Treponema sp.]|jgi:hypothetical protein|nr:hypothetical protein [Treponema sp.]
MTIKKSILFLIVFILAFIAVTCATRSHEFVEIDSAVQQENFTMAIEGIRRGQERRRSLYNERDAILLFLDKGLLEHYAGNWETSFADLQNAERLIEEAFTRSLTQGFLTYIINDNTREYPGEDFEDIYINIFNALNFYQMGNMESALVEIRKLTISSGKLNMLARRHEFVDPNTGANLNEMVSRETGVSQLPDTIAVNFSNSALARYLSVLFYQATGDIDSARIEYEQIHRAFSANRDIYRHQIPSAVEASRTQNIPRGMARLNVLAFSGLSPVKEEQMLIHYIPFPISTMASLSLPILVNRPNQVTRIEVIVEGADSFNLELLEDMGAVIEETYKARFASIFIKTYIRSILKHVTAGVAARQVERRHGTFAGILTLVGGFIFAQATERADIRMSRFLPNHAHIGGINLDPGTYSVIINYYNGNSVIANEHKEVTVNSGRLNLLQSVNLR